MKSLAAMMLLVFCTQAYGMNDEINEQRNITFGDVFAKGLMKEAKNLDFIQASNSTSWATIMASAMKKASIDVVYGGAIWLCIEGTAPAKSTIMVNGQPVINTTTDDKFQLILPESCVPHFLENVSIVYENFEKANVDLNHTSTWVDAPGKVFYNPGNETLLM